jgi:hypothetical protein
MDPVKQISFLYTEDEETSRNRNGLCIFLSMDIVERNVPAIILDHITNLKTTILILVLKYYIYIYGAGIAQTV